VKRQFELGALKSAFFGFILLATAIVAPSSHAVELKADPNKAPYELQNVGVKEHLGEKIDLDLQFTDSADNQKHSLREYFQNGKPTILNLVYYECPMLCTMVLNGVVDGMKGLDWSIGNQFNMITISINPKDDSESAEQKRNAYLGHYTKPAEGVSIQHSLEKAKAGWHFFTSDEVTVKKLADQIGFEYQYDKEQQQYAHAAVTFVLTPEGILSRYLYGITYRARDLRLALLEASQGKVGNVFDRLLMFCYHYEPGARGYSLQAVRVMQLGGAATLAILGGYLAFFWLRQNRNKVSVERKDPVS
jgi:protein SCO1/2